MLTKEDYERCLAVYQEAFAEIVKGVEFNYGGLYLGTNGTPVPIGRLAELQRDVDVIVDALGSMQRIEMVQDRITAAARDSRMAQ